MFIKNIKKTKFIWIFILLIPLLIFSFYACSKKEKAESGSVLRDSKKIEYYTCSMHTFIHESKPGNCPICGMKLVPVYSEAESQPSTPQTESAPAKIPGMSSVRLSNEKQQLIGVTTALVERRMLTREIHAAGRVAFDPELLVAQNEFLIASKTSGGVLGGIQNNLSRAAQVRLKLLGMSELQIQDLKRRGKSQMSLILPQKEDRVWIFASIFESDLPWVKVGTPAEVMIPGSSQTHQSNVESIDPMIDPMTRTGKVRLRISNSEGELKSDMFLRVLLKSQETEELAIPESAVLDTGTQQIAFVDKGEGKFEPRQLKLGKRGSDYTEVLSGVSSGEKVVTNANFLLDSESRLKSALAGMGAR